MQLSVCSMMHKNEVKKPVKYIRFPDGSLIKFEPYDPNNVFSGKDVPFTEPVNLIEDNEQPTVKETRA